MARTQEVLKSFTLKSHQKQLMLMGEKRGRTKKRTTQELQDLDPLGSPHLEERWIGGNVDLGLLLQSSKDQRVWVEGLGDNKEMSLQQWRREKAKVAGLSCLAGGRWRGIYTPPRKRAVVARYHNGVSGPSGRRLRPAPETPAPWGRKLRPPPGGEPFLDEKSTGINSGP
ncbi:hypothetical protein DBT52_09605 [Aerococcus mictus]|nr:hypothetical protein DBT52_09605 [Aerococcus mictus]